MAVQLDGKILAGGAPGSGNVAEYNILMRLNGDGSRDSAFEAGGGLDGSVPISGDYKFFRLKSP